MTLGCFTSLFAFDTITPRLSKLKVNAAVSKRIGDVFASANLEVFLSLRELILYMQDRGRNTLDK